MVIPPYIWTGIFTIVGTITGGLIGAVLSPYINYKWNSRLKEREIEVARETRRLDFYKTLYPERFKAVQRMLDDAAKVYKGIKELEAMQKYSDEPSIHERMVTKEREMFIANREFLFSMRTNKWLLNEEIYSHARKVYDINHDVLTEKGSYTVLEAPYQLLLDASKTFLRLGEYEDLLAEQAPSSKAIVVTKK